MAVKLAKEKPELDFYSFTDEKPTKIKVRQFSVVPDITLRFNNELIVELSVVNARKLLNGLQKVQYYRLSEYYDKKTKKIDKKSTAKKKKAKLKNKLYPFF